MSFVNICVCTVCGNGFQSYFLCKTVLWIELNQCISSGAGYWGSVTGVCQAHGGYSCLLHHLSAWDISWGLLQIQIPGRYKYTHWFINGRTAVWNISYNQFVHQWMLFFRFVYQSPQTGLLLPWSPQTHQMVICCKCCICTMNCDVCLFECICMWKYICNDSLKCKKC